MRALLDVNVLIALLEGGHAMHRRAMVTIVRTYLIFPANQNW